MCSLDRIPQDFRDGLQHTADTIKRLNHILLAAHVNLDGDALGSLCAMGYILKSFNKDCVIYSCTGLPDYLSFMPLPCPVFEDLNNLPFRPEGAIYLDCSEAGRLGKALASIYNEWPSVNIDHHLGDGGIGSLANYIYSKAAATAQLVAYIGMSLDVPLKEPLAECIALGLITDTGGFCHGNTTAAVLELCATLLRNGCDLPYLREKLYNNWSIGKLRLWGSLFTKVRFFAHKEAALCSVSIGEMEEHHCSSEDLEGLAERLRSVKSVKISGVIREEREGLCKFSLRSSGNIDVQVLAAKAGGGGHQNAAGGLLHLPLNEAAEILGQLIEEALKKYH